MRWRKVVNASCRRVNSNCTCPSERSALVIERCASPSCN